MIFALLVLLAFMVLLVLLAQYELKNFYTAASTAWNVEGGFAQHVQHFLAFLFTPGHVIKAAINLVLLAVLGTAAYWVRYFIIEFLGDVVIYVASYKVSEFQEVRNAIQKMVLDAGKQLVAATEPPTGCDEKPAPGVRRLYDKFIFVGHSLGSVVTYDLVNALIVWDRTGCDGRHDLIKRMNRVITFGSPLDKTAFLFRLQTSKDHHYREAMAGLMQPMIFDYQLRPFPWVNLFSHKDPVSGSLAYYDLPDQPGIPVVRGKVINQNDPACTVYGKAHLQYWTGDLLRSHLIAALNEQDPPEPPGKPSGKKSAS